MASIQFVVKCFSEMVMKRRSLTPIVPRLRREYAGYSSIGRHELSQAPCYYLRDEADCACNSIQITQVLAGSRAALGYNPRLFSWLRCPEVTL